MRAIDRKIATKRAELEELEREHKARTKDTGVTPEQHYESARKISELRAEIRDIEKLR